MIFFPHLFLFSLSFFVFAILPLFHVVYWVITHTHTHTHPCYIRSLFAWSRHIAENYCHSTWNWIHIHNHNPPVILVERLWFSYFKYRILALALFFLHHFSADKIEIALHSCGPAMLFNTFCYGSCIRC